MFQFFPQHSLWVLVPAICLLAASIGAFVFSRHKAALVCLLVAALGLRIAMAGFDPFIHQWDERYHALVAKNMVQQPLKPVLYERAVLPYNFKEWNKNHVWLHKQPLALWQIALSYRLFGINTFNTRMPTVIFSTLLVLLIYGMARKCFDKETAYLAALMFTVSYYSLNFSSGGEAVDHVDFAFFFYVSASFWAWINFNNNKETKWRFLIGVFAGLAVLTKWLTGLLVFAGWGIAILADAEQRKNLQAYIKLLKTFVLSLTIFLPWQIYTFLRFPQEASYELGYNRRHMFEAVEGHSGTFWFYIEQLDNNYGWLAPFIIVPALALMWKQAKTSHARNFLFAAFGVCYLFFSLCVTKMPAYCHVVLAIIFIAFGVLAAYVYRWLLQAVPTLAGRFAAFLLLCFLVFEMLETNRLVNDHSTAAANVHRDNQVRFAAYYQQLNNTLTDDYVVFGAPYSTPIEAMFYTGNIFYEDFPGEQQYEQLKQRGEKLAVIVFREEETPRYLMEDPEVKKIIFYP